MADHRTSSATLLDVVFDGIDGGLCLVAPDRTIVRVNDGFLRLTGYGPDEVVGEDVVALFPDNRDVTLALLGRARAGHRVEVPPHVQRVNGRAFRWAGSIAPVPLEGGAGLLITAREVRTDFQLFYETAPVAFLVLAPDRPRFTIVAVSDAYLRATKTSREIVGRGIFEIFPDDPDDPASTGSPARVSFERVLDSAEPDTMAVQKHSIRRPVSEGGGFEERYWSPINTPVVGPDGKVQFIHHRVEDVTEFVRQKQNGVEQAAITEGLRTRAGKLEADVLRRAQDIQRMNHELREANARLAELDRERERRTQALLREQRILLRAISDTSDDAIFAKDRDGRVRFANPAMLEVIGKPLEAVLGRTDAEFLDDKEVAAVVMENDRRVMDAGKAESLEERVPAADGTERTWLSRKAPYRDDKGAVIGLLGISRNITDRKRAEEALRESEEKLRAVLENMSEGVMLFDANGDTVYQNPAALRLHGVTDAEGRFKHDSLPVTWRGWSLDGTPLSFEAWPVSRVLRGEQFQNQTLHAERAETGHAFDASYNGCPIYGPDGRLRYGFITMRDITAEVRVKEEQVRAEQALSAALTSADEERRRLAAVLDALPAGVAIADVDGSITRFNEALVRLWGAPPIPNGVEDYREWRAWRVDSGEPLSATDWAMSRALATGEAVSGDVLEIEKFDGSGRATIVNAAAPIRNAQGMIIGGVVAEIDITAQRRAEEELRRSQAKLRAVFDALVESVVFLNTRGEVEETNESVQSRHGHTLHELRDPDLDPRARMICADGTPFPEQEQPAIVAMRTGRAVRDVEMGMLLRGGGVRWLLVNAQPVYDERRTLLGAVASFFDITQRKHAAEELRRANERLREADRLKDEFLSAASHELRTPLATLRIHVEGMTRLLRDVPSDESRLRRNLSSMEAQVDRLEHLINALLDVTRISAGRLRLESKRCDLARIAAEAVERYQEAAERRGVKLQLNTKSAIGHWDPLRLDQVVTSLVDNALKHALGSVVEIDVRPMPGSAELTVRDYGPGISPESQARIFQQYERAAEARVFGGLGLGLWITRQIVEAHGGSISVHSAPGAGSTFTVKLPQQPPFGRG